MLGRVRRGHVSAFVVCLAFACSPAEFTAGDEAGAGAGGTNSTSGNGGSSGSVTSGGKGGKGAGGASGGGGGTAGVLPVDESGGSAGQATGGTAGDNGSGAGGSAANASGGASGSGGESASGGSGGTGAGGSGDSGSGGNGTGGSGGSGTGGSGTGGSGGTGTGGAMGGNGAGGAGGSASGNGGTGTGGNGGTGTGGGGGTGGSGTGGGGTGGSGGSGGFSGSEPIGGCDNQLLENADFEAGPTPSWVESTTWPGLTIVVHKTDPDLVAEGVTPFAGNYLAWLGGVPDNQWDHHMVILKQDVEIPAAASELTLSGRYLILSVDDPTAEYDESYLEFETNVGTVWQAQRWTNQNTTNGWTAFERSTNDLSRMGGLTVTFVAYTRTDLTGKTSVFLDSLRLVAGCGR